MADEWQDLSTVKLGSSKDEWTDLSGSASPPISNQQEPGFLSRVGTDLSNRASGAWSALTGPDKNPAYPATIPERLLRAGGQVAGGIMDIPTEAVKSVYQTLVPAESRQVLSDFVKPGVQAVTQSAPFQALAQKLKEYPNLTEDTSALMNIAGAIPMVKGPLSLVKGTLPYAKDIASLGKETIMGAPDLAAQTQKIVELGVRKGIKPVGMGSNPKVAKALYEDVATGSKNIVENKGFISLNGETGKVPKTLGETLDAIDQAKKINLDKFLGSQDAAGQAGIVVRPQGLVDELVKMSKADKGEAAHVAQIAQRELAVYADLTEDGQWMAKAFTPKEAQSNVAQLNNILKPYYSNPSFEQLSQTGVKLTVRDQMAAALNDAVESAVGPGHQEFKNTWGALKNMEGQVSKRFNVDVRKAPKGFFDMSTPWTAAKVLTGLAGKDPVSLAASAGMWLTKNYQKAMNEPNRYIKGMFEGLDKIGQRGLRNTSFFADRSLWPPENPLTGRGMPPFRDKKFIK
jgi:hypothetical protein